MLSNSGPERGLVKPALLKLMFCLFFGFVFVVISPNASHGQALASASLTGKVTDNSGAPVQGATVTVTGPALQVPQRTAMTDTEGNYTIVDLPAPGAYRIAFAVTGFQTYVENDVHLTVGLTGKV